MGVQAAAAIAALAIASALLVFACDSRPVFPLDNEETGAPISDAGAE